jgi:uncharacterized lipoprotein YddW (UPF0748 family)
MTGYRRAAFLIAVSLLALHGSARPDSGCRYFWLVRDDLSSAGAIDRALELAEEAGANGVIAQVVGRGEAYYWSDILPLADFDRTFDPLDYLVTRAGPMGLEVHAWVNAFLVWSSPAGPSDSSHVCYSHPEWFMADPRGRSTLTYSREECEAAGLVGATISPADPGVREMLADVAQEIVTWYDVDGIHLDYIRYPGESFGFEDAARTMFYLDCGYDPQRLLTGFGQPPADMQELWARWKQEQVTETVRTIRARLDACAPGVMLTCAVMADPSDAASLYGQDWSGWILEGDIDLAMTMAYTTNPERARQLAVSGTSVRASRLVHGIGIYNQSLSSALAGAREALSRGAAGICVFSLNSLEDGEAYDLRNSWASSGGIVHDPNPALFYRTGCGTAR